ncbi:flagellar basal-body rod protein FlgG [Alkalibacillus filiformis]|uniref:Flagellar basal-body rod protein FlgG n=1 Tax=Alkalibacillus filiformis TaxID=200990 RepID=A0ABU0DW86_9BACI|nr:flagellar hook-basal body protein [Alkalibacillus filiformis]MDQ0352695.1 flagellar basal-body rod protein FlgG [Alkalibacillus filiformis]
MRNMFNAAATMGQMQQRMDLTSNNLSNINNHGYKAREGQFSSLLYQQHDNILDYDQGSPRLTPDGIRVGAGARLSNTNMNMTSGTIEPSDRPLDVAIQDDYRFFVVNAPTEDGEVEERYTRAGNFYLSEQADGSMMLTTNAGYPVEGQDGPITLDGEFDDISINESGEVEVTRDGDTAVEATLQLVDIENTRVMEPVDANSFTINEEDLEVPVEELVAEVAPIDANLAPSALEGSNVNMAKEMTDLLEAQRAYQFNARSLSIGDQMMGLIGNMR